MKKSLIALTALAGAGMASAQSSLTFYGAVDTSLQHVSNSGGANGTAVSSSGYNGSRFGLRGTEDLGGGLSASFWMEAALLSDNGTGQATNTNNQASGTATAAAGTQGITFNRRSFVGLAGGWGEIRLGRDYTPQAMNLLLFDPFGAVGLGGTQMFYGELKLANSQTGLRASNTVGYLLPGKTGFYGQAQYYLGENASNAANSKDGRGGGVRIGWAGGPIDVAAGYGKTTYVAGDFKLSNLGASYDFGSAKLMLMLSRDESGPVAAKGWQLGATARAGASGHLRLAYARYKTNATAQNPTSSKLSVGYVHNLSKRTALYTTYARVNNSGGASSTAGGTFGSPAANRASTGYDVGIRHNF